MIATGGTIASEKGPDGLSPALSPDDLLARIPEADRHGHSVAGLPLMNIDSTNMQPEDWAAIAQTVERHYRKYDGFIVTHGSDTLAYTAAALSYMLRGAGKPIILTGSMLPIGAEDSDAVANLSDAIYFAGEDAAGVFVVFDGKVIQGTRAVKLRTKSRDAFRSVNAPLAAVVDGKRMIYTSRPPRRSEGELKAETAVCTDVFLLKLHPGVKPELFDRLEGLYKGIIIESFGSGGIPSDRRNLLPAIGRLAETGVSIVVTTQSLEEGVDLSLYEVGRKAAGRLIIVPQDMNTEAIVPKLMWALGQAGSPLEVKAIMETPVAGDF